MTSPTYSQRITDGHRLTIYFDYDCESPRENDNLGTFVMRHNKYAYGDVNNPSELEIENMKAEMEEGYEQLPVYMIDHSGVGFSTGDFNDKWDSGQVGFIYVTHKKIKNVYGELTPETIEKARKCLQSEIEELDIYTRGECYGYILEEAVVCDKCRHTNMKHIDSCSGFITETPEKDIIEQLGQKYKDMFKEETK